jgi:PleD family two-component response regulator
MRFGGDEFVCVVASLDQDDVGCRLARADTVLANGPAPGSVIVGLAQLRSGDTAHDLIERADQVLV